MLECSGAASAVNADVMYCKDDMIRGKGFLFFTVLCGLLYLILSRTEHAVMSSLHVHE